MAVKTIMFCKFNSKRYKSLKYMQRLGKKAVASYYVFIAFQYFAPYCREG